jgi:hypothetical protein
LISSTSWTTGFSKQNRWNDKFADMTMDHK